MSRLQSGGWALVLTDLHLPGLSGMDLLARIRRDWPHLAVVMMTGAGDLRNGIAAMQSGAEDYLAKPIQIDLLKASLMRALDHRRVAAELDLYHRRLEVMVAERTRETREVFARMEQVYEETLAVLSAALDLRDTETAGHSRRVAAYALRLANSLGCSEDIRDNLLRASYLHDIGKMGIADAILLKPSALTSAERDIMQSHVQIGYEMVRHFSFLAPVAEIVHSHHERWDGLGYPAALPAPPFRSKPASFLLPICSMPSPATVLIAPPSRFPRPSMKLAAIPASNSTLRSSPRSCACRRMNGKLAPRSGIQRRYPSAQPAGPAPDRPRLMARLRKFSLCPHHPSPAVLSISLTPK